MRISSFVPAIFGFALFTASTQALPTPHQQEQAIDILKRGTGNTLDALVKLFVDIESKVLVDACVSLEANVCADAIVKLNANVNLLNGLVKTHVNVKDLEVSAKAKADVDLKVQIRAYVNAIVIANIEAHVRAVALGICPKGDNVCLGVNADLIVSKVVALIKVDIGTLVVKIKANVAAYVKVRVEAHVQELALNLGILNVDASAIVRIRSDIDVHIEAFVKICAEVLVNAKLIAAIKAL